MPVEILQLLLANNLGRHLQPTSGEAERERRRGVSASNSLTPSTLNQSSQTKVSPPHPHAVSVGLTRTLLCCLCTARPTRHPHHPARCWEREGKARPTPGGLALPTRYLARFCFRSISCCRAKISACAGCRNPYPGDRENNNLGLLISALTLCSRRASSPEGSRSGKGQRRAAVLLWSPSIPSLPRQCSLPPKHGTGEAGGDQRSEQPRQPAPTTKSAQQEWGNPENVSGLFG